MSTCYVVATPIGNLQDMTPRAVETLKSVKAIFAEDTRVSAKLLLHFGINVPLISLHEHNEMSRLEKITDYLSAGDSVAIISDAGTPLISDPGFTVVQHLRKEGFLVVPIPGVSAIITALSVAGIPTDRFTFIGFLPSKKGQRQSELAQLAKAAETLIFYESSHRILAMLADLVATFGAERKIFVGREMTKRFEDYRYGTAESLYHHYEHHSSEIRGEFVVVTTGEKQVTEAGDLSYKLLLETLMAEKLPLKQISTILHKVTGRAKNELYQELLALKDEESSS
ncbi:ribosomal RNA small subunit methyltransferase I [Ignatzschineria indica]|uniref:Ribosomal RNA small subunit methyltransferase I n=1 Tax=Ignatzschineria indica TaxID=472583 RepID=A0A2U2AJ92_9GAMM|nr:16S rRNA (cytidine(1402)-2'-O)-methyltransferase [Ignatzschineria indica]PWD82722.1 16S rRNA (cytidine(1402)-2'-O)-methyltransferase [Ignatzschineria indica]GGZ86345.1 ribosomal RNA small subunit methyltransferase I [Ignatzschineria indica]